MKNTCVVIFLFFNIRTNKKIFILNTNVKMKRRRADTPDSEPIKEHDSGFVGPMTLFDTFPHNDTFDETRDLQLLASPVDTQADVYTFMHNRQDYGVLKTEDAMLKVKISIHAANGTAAANDRVIVLCTAPLQFGWKSKEVYINNQLINPSSNKDNELAYVNHLMSAVPSNYKDENDITLMIHDTPGHFSDVTNVLDAGGGFVNLGGRARYSACNQATALTCIDSFDLMGYNKRYVPTSFDFKVVLTRLEKTKMLMGTTAHCRVHHIRYTDLQLSIPIMKPNAQLSAAIKELMIQKNEECQFYVTNYRYVAKPIPIGSRHIIHQDLFNGARPGRVITKIVVQTVYNGDHTLNPNIIPFPNIDYFSIKINEAVIPPVYTNSQEAYMSLRQILDRCYSEMPFSHSEYRTSFGVIVNDLSPNKDGHSQVLPNSTSGNVGVEINFTANTTAAQQLICIGKFRNELSVGYGTQARLKYDF